MNLTCQCYDDVPSGIEIKEDVFGANIVPKMDELDAFIVNKSGCKYRGVQGRSYMDASRETFNGTSFEAHFAIRAPEHALINLWWREFSNQDYLFLIEEDGYKLKQLQQHGARTLAEKKTFTNILSGDHYEKFYLRLDNETLTFGRECDREPMLKHNISIEEGETVWLRFRSDSFYGAKFLYYCPAGGAELTGGSHSVRQVTRRILDRSME